MHAQQKKWLYLLTLSLVWGSSFILMKKALIALSPIQVGALRMCIAALFLLSFGFKSLKQIQKKHYKYIVFNKNELLDIIDPKNYLGAAPAMASRLLKNRQNIQ